MEFSLVPYVMFGQVPYSTQPPIYIRLSLFLTINLLGLASFSLYKPFNGASIYSYVNLCLHCDLTDVVFMGFSLVPFDAWTQVPYSNYNHQFI